MPVKMLIRRDHRTDGGGCWCRPYEEHVEGGVILIHNDEVGVWLNLHPYYLAEMPDDDKGVVTEE